MNAPNVIELSEGLHRLAKLALDSGEASSVEEAMRLFESYSLHIHAGASLGSSPSQQAALLTAVNAGRRAFLGGVTVSGVADAPSMLPIGDKRMLAETVVELGGRIMNRPARAAGTLLIGTGGRTLPHGVRTFARGWIAGCGPAADDSREDDPNAFVLAGVAAGALGVAECFQQVRGSQPAAGRRRVALSLWRPDLPVDDPEALGCHCALLPSSAWLIGLGNLGQAYLWCLGLLPYAAPDEVTLVLNDFDLIAPSNESTSLLTARTLVGFYKTRAMADWAERRGFRTSILERRFSPLLKVGGDDPAVCLCGVDNALARSALEEAGFSRIFEAGLGNGLSDFLAMRVHSFPGPRSARSIWSGGPAKRIDLLDRPAYQALDRGGADKCGLVQLAGRTVGAPFVGALAGAMVIAELVKLANGGPNMSLIDLHLRVPDQLQAFSQESGFACNPGITAACASA